MMKKLKRNKIRPEKGNEEKERKKRKRGKGKKKKGCFVLIFYSMGEKK
jgi:hypothetical protein